MDKDITDYVNKYVACPANVLKEIPEPISMLKLPDYLWSQTAIDFYGPFSSDENLFMLMVMYLYLLIEVSVFKKICFKVKVLETFKIFADCHIKTCRSLKLRTILKISHTVL